MREDTGYQIHHHVQLPSGRQIEVVYLDSRRDRGDTGVTHTSLSHPAPENGHAGTTSSSWHGEATPRPQTTKPRATKTQTTQSDTHVALTPWPDKAPSSAPGEALHVCPRCAGGLVHPLDWTEESPGRWRILMRCPDCGLVREGVFGETLVERLDEELDMAASALLSDLDRITRANMTAEIELFARALQLDLIGPSDFER